MFSAIVAITVLGLTLGYVLGLASRYLKVDSNPLVDEIEAMLPGSQCGQCGFPGCSGAAQALTKGETPVTLCPPGGRSLAQALAEKLGVEADLSALVDGPPRLVRISEATCIGCTRCFKVCPTDAIVGAPKQIHTVFQSACTACGKCVDVCPTECLRLQPASATLQSWRWPKPALAA